MQSRLSGVSSSPPAQHAAGSIVVIGNFDGVHVGHQAVLAAVARVARDRALRATILTFEPHPAVVVGRTPPARLCTLARKLELLDRACPGIEVVVREFTDDFARLTPAQFAAEVLVGELGAAVVMVGFDFRFGVGRSGGFGELEQLGSRLGFEAIAEPLVCDDLGPWSSTRVRELVAAGDVAGAATMLGRPHMLSGVVARGDARGRTLGFPTCNVAEVAEAQPAFGVYAVLVDRVAAPTNGAVALAKGVASLGVRPTVHAAQSPPLLEVHLFDHTEDLYGARLRVHLVSRLRPELRYPDLDALRQQMTLDAQGARAALEGWDPDPLAAGGWA